MFPGNRHLCGLIPNKYKCSTIFILVNELLCNYLIIIAFSCVLVRFIFFHPHTSHLYNSLYSIFIFIFQLLSIGMLYCIKICVPNAKLLPYLTRFWPMSIQGKITTNASHTIINKRYSDQLLWKIPQRLFNLWMWIADQ